MKPNMSNQQEGKKKKNYKNLKGINGVILLGNIKVSLVQACGWLIGVLDRWPHGPAPPNRLPQPS